MIALIASLTKYKIRSYRYFLILLFIITTACSKPLPSFDSLDLEAWRSDKNGCQGKRVGMRQSLIDQKEKLLALDQMQITKILGNPDQNELLSRNQKLFFYFVEPSASCNGGDSTSVNPLKLSIRFNAMGLAKQIEIK